MRAVYAFGGSVLFAALAASCSSSSDGALTPNAPPEAPSVERRLLSQAGLYAYILAKVLSSDIQEYAPAFPLWSDDAEKTRWIRLPAGARIDTRDMEHWQFPVGTAFFKEFSVLGKRVETRLILRVKSTGDSNVDYWQGAFVWNDDESDATLALDGARNVRGTPHDVPTQTQCGTCHSGEPGHILGFSALQLSHGGSGLTLEKLIAGASLTAPPPPQTRYAPAGDARTRSALGYLHANCGHCHNPNGNAWADVDMVLRVPLETTPVEQTDIYKSTVGVPLFRYRQDGLTERVVPGYPDRSALFLRLDRRGTHAQMPPVATELVDQVGSDSVRAWISGLPAK